MALNVYIHIQTHYDLRRNQPLNFSSVVDLNMAVFRQKALKSVVLADPFVEQQTAVSYSKVSVKTV